MLWLLVSVEHTSTPSIRSTCGNHITKWHYCYHTEAATPGATLSMTVAVWSLHFGKKCVYCDNFSVPCTLRFFTVWIQLLTHILCLLLASRPSHSTYSNSSQDFLCRRVSKWDWIYTSITRCCDRCGFLPSNTAIPLVSSSASSEKIHHEAFAKW